MAADHGPGVRIPPPVFLLAVMAGAYALDLVWRVELGPPAYWLGGTAFAAAVGLIGWSVLAMLRAGTDPRPDRPDAALLESGPFALSRNPIYLGFLLIAAGFGLVRGTLWPALGVVALVAILGRLVIAREEAYLAARFGAAYEAYRGRVRRWL